MASEQTQWRVLDTGIRRAAENFALNRAILEAHQEGHVANTLRFLQFESSALIGFHQDVEQELNVDYCRQNNVDIQRRITGGGAIYFDETQLGWELYLSKHVLGTADMEVISRRICETAAMAMSDFGIDATFRPRNDIEVDGRKISGTGGAFDGDSIMFQGTLLLSFDIERMLKVLRIPAEKLQDKALASAAERVTSLELLLKDKAPTLDELKASLQKAFAKTFQADMQPEENISDIEQTYYLDALEEIDDDEWIYQHNRPQASAPTLSAVHKFKGGLLRANAMVDTEKLRLKQLWLSGDVFIKPARLMVDLEAALRNSNLRHLDANVHAFFDGIDAEMMHLSADDFIQIIRQALSEDAALVQALEDAS